MKKLYRFLGGKHYEPVPGGGIKAMVVGALVELTARQAQQWARKFVEVVVEQATQVDPPDELPTAEEVAAQAQRDADAAAVQAQADRKGDELIDFIRARTASDADALREMQRLERLNPKRENGRVGVLKAIDEQLASFVVAQ